MSKLKIYETEKRYLQALNLTPEEYTKAIRALCKRLKL